MAFSLLLTFYFFLFIIAIAWKAIADYNTSVSRDQRSLRRRTLREIRADPALCYARWIQDTGTQYVCGVDITTSVAYRTKMCHAGHPAPVSPPTGFLSPTYKSLIPATSSPASDPKAGYFDSGSNRTARVGEIHSDLSNPADTGTSQAIPPSPTTTDLVAETPTTGASAESPVGSESAACSTDVLAMDDGGCLYNGSSSVSFTASCITSAPPSLSSSLRGASSSLPLLPGEQAAAPSGLPGPHPKRSPGKFNSVSFLGPWSFPKGGDGTDGRWLYLQGDKPSRVGLGTPGRPVLLANGHIGQLQRAKPFDREWKKFPLTPQQEARQAQRTKEDKERKARSDARAFRERAAQFHSRTSKLRAAMKPAFLGSEIALRERSLEALSREEFRRRVAVWKQGIEKLKAVLLGSPAS